MRQPRRSNAMTQIPTKEQLRQKRRQLYKNPVFITTQEALKPLVSTHDPVGLFVFAEDFTNNLLQNPPLDRSLMEYEVDDIREDVANDVDCQLVFILAFVILHAQRHENSVARKLSHILLYFCKDYNGLKDLFAAFITKEQQLRHEGILPSSARVSRGEAIPHPPNSGATSPETRRFVAQLVDNCKALTPDSIERILVPLMATNEQYHNAFDPEVNRLKEKLGMKTTPGQQSIIRGDFVMEKKVENEVNGVENGGIGIIIKNIKEK